MTAHAPHGHDDHHEAAHTAPHGHDDHHEAAHTAPHGHDDHHEAHYEPSHTSAKVVELLDFGGVKAERVSPLKSLTDIVRTGVNVLLSPLERIQEVAQTSVNAVGAVNHEKGIKAKIIQSLKGIWATGTGVLSVPFKVIGDIYKGIGNSLTHLTNGTSNWFGNVGKTLTNILKQIYWLPEALYNKLMGKGEGSHAEAPAHAEAHAHATH